MRSGSWLAGWLVLAGCAAGSEPGRALEPPVVRSASTPPMAPAPPTSGPGPVGSAAAAPSADPPIDTATFARLFDTLSEPDHEFFSDNFVSNETSYLQVAAALPLVVRKGGAYLGVGPEQNFTYIGLTEPRLAFIVDLRRANALEHLLYKAIFDVARSRSEFLALLLGRPYDGARDPGAQASLAEVIAAVERGGPDPALQRRRHGELVRRIEEVYGVRLSATDRDGLAAVHRAFFERQLRLRFSLEHENGRIYPMLRELLGQASPAGAQLGFLAVEAEFRTVQRLQREHRIVPVVGDFAGPRALRAVGRELAARELRVSVFYVSNVEQYLLSPAQWAAWRGNVASLPVDEASLFLRCYLDQGRRHPAQLRGHRTATVLAPVADFKARWTVSVPRNQLELTTQGLLP